MKKIVILLLASFFIPFYIFIALEASYLSRIYYTGIWEHSILLLIICSTALSISYYCYKYYARDKTPSFFILSLFFIIIGVSFFLHSIAIPSFYFLNERIFDITEHFGLFLASGVLMALFFPERFIKEALYDNKKKIFFGSIFAMVLLYAAVFLSQDLSKNLADSINYFIFISGVFLIAGISRLLQAREMIFGHMNFYYFIAGLSMLVNAAIIPFFYKEWNLSWWYFHIVILIAELIIFWGMVKDKKRI